MAITEAHVQYIVEVSEFLLSHLVAEHSSSNLHRPPLSACEHRNIVKL